MPCETAKRDLSRSGRERTSRSNVAPSQGAKLPRGGWRRTTFLPAFAFSASRRFSMTCSGAWATTQPRSSKPLRPARPAIWWKSRAESTAVFSPSYFERRLKSTVRMGTLTPTPSVSVPQTTLSRPCWASRSASTR